MSEQVNVIPGFGVVSRTVTEEPARTQGRVVERDKLAKTGGSPGPVRPPQNDDDDEEEAEPGFLKRNRGLLIGGGVAVAGIVWLVSGKHSGSGAPARKAPEPMTIKVQLPPPPKVQPPPPKIQPPPKDQKAPEQANTVKPEAAKPKPAEKPPEGLGTNNKGVGRAIPGLGSTGNGSIGGIGGGSGKGGSAAAWYAGQVQSRIAAALRSNPKTRNASLRMVVRVWPDSSGRVTRAQLAGSTGDAALDSVIKEEILSGIQLQEGPPAGMALPIALRLTVSRPG